MESKEEIYKGIWRDNRQWLFMVDFIREQFFSKGLLLAFLAAIAISGSIMVAVIYDGESEYRYLWMLMSLAVSLAIIVGLSFLFFYHKKWLRAEKDAVYTVSILKKGEDGYLLLESGEASHLIKINRIFLSSSYAYVGKNRYEYVVLPPVDAIIKPLYNEFFDKLAAPYR